MNLHNGKFYWPETYHPKTTFPMLEEDIKTDVLIIGGGGSGTQCAYRLANSGLSITVVDQRAFGQGSTSSNTALIQYAGDKTFTELISSFGEEAAVKHLKLCEAAISELEAICPNLPVNPDYKRRDSLYYASYEEDVEKLKIEYAYLKKHGFSCDLWSEEKIGSHYSFKKRAALYYFNDAELNPYKLVYGLLDAVKPAIRCYENTKVTRMKAKEGEHQFHTRNGKTIIAKHAIVCGGYETLELKKEKNAVISSSYAIVTSPVEHFAGWHKQSLIWESARPYIYMRTTPDNRIIIGGLDEDTAIPEERDAKITRKKEKLVNELNKLFPDYEVKADYYLGAMYGGTHDGLPVIGMYEDWPDCYFLMGYGDNGTVYSMVLSKIISEHILNGRSTNLDLYLQIRPSIRS